MRAGFFFIKNNKGLKEVPQHFPMNLSKQTINPEFHIQQKSLQKIKTLSDEKKINMNFHE